MSRRCYVKCEKCRKDRKSCLPLSRNWDRKERCDRCRSTGHECGPPIQTRPGRRRLGLKSHIRVLQQPVCTDHASREAAGDSSNSDAETTQLRDQGGHHETPVDNSYSLYTTLLGTILLERLLLASVPDYDRYRRSTLISQELEQLCSRTSSYQEILHQRTKELLVIKTRDDDNECRSIPVADFLLCQLEERCHMAFLRQAMPGQRVLVEDFDPDNWIATQHYLPELQGILACVAYMPVTTSPMSEDSARQDLNVHISDRITRYKKAEALTRELLGFLQAIDSQSRDLRHQGHSQIQIPEQTFPASHIALINGDTKAAFRLWLECPDKQAIDLLGRSLAHLAVIAGNMNFLKKLSQRDITSLQVRNDSLGLSLEATATILNDDLTFVVLRNRIGPRMLDPCILRFAIDVGNPTIVQTILDSRLGQPPYTHYVQQAIQCGQLEIVEIFLGPLEAHPHTQDDINLLANVATQSGHEHLAHRLQNLRPVPPTFRDAIDDLNGTQIYISSLYQASHTSDAFFASRVGG